MKLTDEAELERRKNYRFVVSTQIKNGTIKTFGDIFRGKRFPKTYLVQDLHIGAPRMNKLISYPGLLTLEDCVKIGKYFDVPAATIALLGFNQINAQKRPR